MNANGVRAAAWGKLPLRTRKALLRAAKVDESLFDANWPVFDARQVKRIGAVSMAFTGEIASAALADLAPKKPEELPPIGPVRAGWWDRLFDD